MMEILSERELLNLITGGRPMTWCEVLVQMANGESAQDWDDEEWDRWGTAFEHCA